VFVDQAAQDWFSADLARAGVGCGDAGTGAIVRDALADAVPLEYSIEWLTCAIASRLDVVMVGLPGAAQDRLPAHVPVLGLAVLAFRGTGRRMLSCWCSGTRTRCCADTPAGCGTSLPTGCGSPRWRGSYRAGAGPTSSP
jgi:hypothetical protein